MNQPQFSERELEKMLTSKEESLVTKALKYMYHSSDWQSVVQNSVACPTAFFEGHFSKLFAAFKFWLSQKGNATRLRTSGVSITLKKLWKEYVHTFLTDEDLLQMFRADDDTTILAMEIFHKRFYTKTFAALMKKKPDEAAVKDVMQDTFVKVFERFTRTKEDFSFKSNMEAYYMSSCKHAYWKYWDKKQLPYEEIENNPAIATMKWVEYVTSEEENCFEKKVLPQLGDTCKKILGMVYCGHKNPEIAREHDYSVGYVKKKKSVCLEKARALVQDCCGDL